MHFDGKDEYNFWFKDDIINRYSSYIGSLTLPILMLRELNKYNFTNFEKKAIVLGLLPDDYLIKEHKLDNSDNYIYYLLSNGNVTLGRPNQANVKFDQILNSLSKIKSRDSAKSIIETGIQRSLTLNFPSMLELATIYYAGKTEQFQKSLFDQIKDKATYIKVFAQEYDFEDKAKSDIEKIYLKTTEGSIGLDHERQKRLLLIELNKYIEQFDEEINKKMELNFEKKKQKPKIVIPKIEIIKTLDSLITREIPTNKRIYGYKTLQIKR